MSTPVGPPPHCFYIIQGKFYEGWSREPRGCTMVEDPNGSFGDCHGGPNYRREEHDDHHVVQYGSWCERMDHDAHVEARVWHLTRHLDHIRWGLRNIENGCGEPYRTAWRNQIVKRLDMIIAGEPDK